MNVINAFLQQVRKNPHGIAVCAGQRTLTYEQLAARAGRIAASLAGRGIAVGDAVALRLEGVQLMAAVLGVGWLGAVSACFKPGPSWPETGSYKATLVSGRDPAPPPAPGMWLSFSTLLRDKVPPIPVAQREPEDIWSIGLSSGTTGKPKGILFSHASGVAKTRVNSSIPGIVGERTLVFMGLGLPFASAYWMRELARGKTVVLARSGAGALDAIARHDVDLVVASPSTALELANAAAGAARSGPLVRTLVVGGAPLNRAQRELLRERISRNLWVNYGASEIGMVALLPPKLMDSRPKASGRIAPWVEVQVLDPAGQPLPPGQPGVLRMRAPTMGSGYVDGTQSNSGGFKDGWFFSNDRGVVTADGLVFLAGREDDVLNVGGVKVDPAVIEEVVCQWPGVRECAVVQVAGGEGAPVLAAFVAADRPLDSKGLVQHCRERLDGPRSPTMVIRVDSLPRNDSGKVVRRELALLAAGRQQPVH